MKNILLYIQSSNHPIFQKNILALVKGYKRIIERHNLNITIHTVCGFIEGRENYIEDTLINVDDHQFAKVNFVALEKFINEPFDVIIKTNTNTVVNLQLLQMYCDSTYFDENTVYTNIVHYPDPELHKDYPGKITDIIFPSGSFTMASKQIWEQIVNHYDDAIKFADLWFKNDDTLYHNDFNQKNSSIYWTGYCDDFLYGLCLLKAGITNKITLLNSTISQDKLTNFSDIIGVSTMDDISEKYLVINCKLDNSNMSPTEFGSSEEYFRTYYEHHMITAICKIFEFYKPTYNDLYKLGNNIFYFV